MNNWFLLIIADWIEVLLALGLTLGFWKILQIQTTKLYRFKEAKKEPGDKDTLVWFVMVLFVFMCSYWSIPKAVNTMVFTANPDIYIQYKKHDH